MGRVERNGVTNDPEDGEVAYGKCATTNHPGVDVESGGCWPRSFPAAQEIVVCNQLVFRGILTTLECQPFYIRGFRNAAKGDSP